MTVLTRRTRLFAVRLGFVGLAAASLATTASAQTEEPVETAIKGWIAALDASPNWVAGFAEMSYDSATHTVTIKNLSIRSETLATKVEISFGTVNIAGFGQNADGSVQASSVTADNEAIIIGDVVDARLADIGVSNLAIPSFADFRFDPAHIVTSMVKAYAIGTKTTFDKLHVGSAKLTQTVQDQKSEISLGTYEMGALKDGKIAQLTAGPVTEEIPAPDGLMNLKVEKVEARDYDLNALVEVLDPSHYSGGVGDGKWRSVLALESYRNVTVGLPGGTFRVGNATVEDIKVRQPPKNPAEFLDSLFANAKMPEDQMRSLMLQNLPSLLQLVGVGAYRIEDVDLSVTGLSQFHLGEFHINDLSSDGLGEIGIGDLYAAVDEKGTFGAERFVLGGFKFPSMEALARAIEAEANGVASDPLALAPTLGYAEAVNVDVTQDGKPFFALDRGRIDLSKYLGPVPTSVAVDTRGIKVDVSQIQDAKARDMLEGLGYDQLNADYVFRLDWREADESVTLSGFKLAVKDLATLTGSAFLTGLKRSALDDPRHLEQSLDGLLFNRADIAVTDQSVTGRAFAMQAKKMNTTPDKLRQQVTGALPFFMMALKNPTFQQKLAPALQAFLTAPGTFSLHIEPKTPMAVVDVIQAAHAHPQQLPDLLNIDVKSAPPAAATP